MSSASRLRTRKQESDFRFVPLRRPARRTLRVVANSGGPRGQHHGRSEGGPSYTAGDPVPQSGIYEVVHARAHRAAHEVVMLSGDVFPPCDSCDQAVRFRLVRTAPYIFQDEDFEEQ
jgi:hypothetical protein